MCAHHKRKFGCSPSSLALSPGGSYVSRATSRLILFVCAPKEKQISSVECVYVIVSRLCSVIREQRKPSV